MLRDRILLNSAGAIGYEFLWYNSVMTEPKDINATVSSMGYGFQVTATFNGVDIGMKGGQSESMRLFSKDHSMFNEVPPEMRSRLFVLQPGENAFHLAWKKTGQESDKLTFEMYLEGKEEPYFLFSTTDKEGVFDKTFSL